MIVLAQGLSHHVIEQHMDVKVSVKVQRYIFGCAFFLVSLQVLLACTVRAVVLLFSFCFHLGYTVCGYFWLLSSVNILTSGLTLAGHTDSLMFSMHETKFAHDSSFTIKDAGEKTHARFSTGEPRM